MSEACKESRRPQKGGGRIVQKCKLRFRHLVDSGSFGSSCNGDGTSAVPACGCCSSGNSGSCLGGLSGSLGTHAAQAGAGSHFAGRAGP